MASVEGEKDKKVVVPKTSAELQRFKLDKLMKNPNKPAFVPDKSEEKQPKVFNPPEFIRNIWGSSAGAGSGDFHVYRGVRKRENARQKYLTAKSEKDKLDAKYHEKVEENQKKAEERTNKKRLKRLKKKQRQAEKKQKTKQQKNGKDESEDSSCDSEDENQEEKDS